MSQAMKKTYGGVLVAATLWFVMFSPWTAHLVNFWYTMTCSGLLLSGLALWWGDKHEKFVPGWALQLLAGVVLAVVLWGVFWVGDKVSQWMFSFAGQQIDGIYSMKGGMSSTTIALLLFFVIGPAEELFWRGFVQRRLSTAYGPWIGFIVAAACYTLVHIWSFNFILIAAAAVCGGCWGLLYRLRPQMLPALVISHSLWDVAAFVVFPF